MHGRTIACLAIISIMICGCKSVEHKEAVQYENGEPVAFARVYEVGDNYVGVTTTDDSGAWKMYGPPGIRVQLCIENPMDDYNLACWDEVERREFLRFPNIGEEPKLKRMPYVEENDDGDDGRIDRVYDEWVRYRNGS